jgi:hypothetical protein
MNFGPNKRGPELGALEGDENVRSQPRQGCAVPKAKSTSPKVNFTVFKVGPELGGVAEWQLYVRPVSACAVRMRGALHPKQVR